ncbi:MAG TPA: SgcJ/EcaC family oxidoreductase [Rhodothermales bacterium]|nr:SgcJ/EcaC family oxidoreductase [Rhodothermales bacterium]
MKAPMQALVLICLAGIAPAAYAQQWAATAGDTQQISAILDNWGRDWNSGDKASVRAAFAEDAVVVLQGDVLRGLDEIDEKWLARAMPVSTIAGSQSVASLVGQDLAYQTGYYDMDHLWASGNQTAESGTYTLIWRKQADGNWKIVTAQVSPTMPVTGDVAAAIEEADKQFSDAWSKGDANGVASLYTEDGQMLVPNAETLKGRDAIRQALQGMFQQGRVNLTLKPADVHAYGDRAVEEGGYVMESPEGQHLDHGKYIVIWKLDRDGQWRLHRDIFNSSMPPH